MKKVIAKLKRQVDAAIYAKDDTDSASWNRNEGVLITVNEAQAIIQMLEAAMDAQDNEPYCQCLRITRVSQVEGFLHCAVCGRPITVTVKINK